MLNVVVKDVNFVSANTGILEAVGVRLERSCQSFLSQVGSNVEIFEPWIAFAGVDDQLVLSDQVRLFFLLSLTSFVLFLNILDELERSVQVVAKLKIEANQFKSYF